MIYMYVFCNKMMLLHPSEQNSKAQNQAHKVEAVLEIHRNDRETESWSALYSRMREAADVWYYLCVMGLFWLACC